MSSRLKARGHQKRRSGKPYERKSVLEKVKEFFTPSYWLGTGGPTDDVAEDESRYIFNPPYTHLSDNPCTSRTPQSDAIIIDDTKSDEAVPSLSVSKKNEKGSQAWKKNMISLNEDMETGPSQVFQNEAGGSVISPPESTSDNALHNTKLFIPASLNAPQHSTPLKKSGQVSMQSGSDPATINVTDTLPEQHEATTTDTRKESTASSSAIAPRLQLHQSGSMLTPPDSPTLESHAGGNRTGVQSHHLSSIVSPSRFNIPHGKGPLRSPYYSGRTTFGGASSQVKMRTVKRRRSEDNQTSPELPPVRQQLHARPATHHTTVASQTAKQILESLKNYSTPVSNAKRFPIRNPVTPLMSPKESVVPAAKRHRTKPTAVDKQHEGIGGPPVNPLLTPYKAHIMTLPPVTPPTDDRLHSNPIAMTTTAQPTSTHKPHPLAAAASTSTFTSLSTTQQGLLTNKLCTSETTRLKEKSQDSGQPVSEGFATGWVGGASGKIKEKKHSMHESNKGDDEQINPMEMPKAVPLQLSSSGKLPSFSFTPGFLQKKGDSDDAVSKEASIPSVTTSTSAAYNFSQPKTIMTGSKSTASKELDHLSTNMQVSTTLHGTPVKFSFSTPKQHSSETVPVAPAISNVLLPMCSAPSKISFPSQLNLLPSTQPLSLSGSAAVIKSSERKPLPLKSGSCLEILKPSKPAVEDKTVKEDSQSTPQSLLSQKFKPAEGSWECPTCMVNNKATDDKCAACATSRPGSAPAATAAATIFSTGVASTSLTSQQSLLSQKFKPVEGSWECPTCMVNNKATDDKCAACTTSKPGSAPTAGAVSTSSAPQQSLLSQKFKPAEGSWECPTCMVNNKATDDKCLACTTSRPGNALTGFSSTLSSSSGHSLSGKGIIMGSGGGLQVGSSGGLKLGIMKDSEELKASGTGGFKLGSSGGLQLGSGGGLQLGSSGGFKLGNINSEPVTVTEPTSGGFKLGASGGFKLGLSSDLKLGSGGDSKLGSSSDSKLSTSGNLNLSSGGGLQMGSTNSNILPPLPSNIIITTTITSGFSTSSTTTQSLSTRFKPAEGSWECPTCMVNNKATDDRCAACATSRPGSALTASSTEGSTSLSMSGPGIKFGVSGGLQLGPLSSQNVSSNSSSKPMLLSGQQPSAQLTIKPLDASTATGSGGLKIGSSSSGGLQLGSSGGLQLGSSGGLQLGTGGLQSGSLSGGIKLGLPTNVQPASGEAIKLIGSAEGVSATDNLGGIKLPLLGKKRPFTHTEDENKASAFNVEPVIGNKSLVGNPLGLAPLNRPAVTTTKSVTFKLDGDNTKTDNASNSRQASFGIPQPSLATGGGLSTSSGFTLVGSASGDSKLAATSDSSSTKPFPNIFSHSSTTNSSIMNFAFPKPTSTSALATTSASTLLNAPLSFNTGLSSATTTSAGPPKLFDFTQQALFTTPGQGQQGSSGGLDLKLPTCQEKKEISGNVIFNFSGAKSNELSSQGQQGISTGLGLTQATTQPGFNFHAAMQNQGGSIFNTTIRGSTGLTTSLTGSSVLFADHLNTNQADNTSGMEISNPATGEPQHLPSLTAPAGQSFQLQFGSSSNPTQPFNFNSQQNPNQQNQNMFEGNSSNMFGTNNSVLGSNLPANMIFSATPSISNRPIKKARRRVPNRP